MFDFIAFDLETTGTRPAEDRIVEIGAVRFEQGQAVEGYGCLVNPGIPIPLGASQVNGITDEMVQDKPPIQDVLGAFTLFCGGLPLVAHNAPFDFKFLLNDIERLRVPAPQGIVLDTLPLSRKILPGMVNYRLGTLTRHFELTGGGFHRAEADSAYCGKLFVKLLKILKQRGEVFDPEALVQLSGKKALQFPQYKPEPDQLGLF